MWRLGWNFGSDFPDSRWRLGLLTYYWALEKNVVIWTVASFFFKANQFHDKN